MLTLKLESTPEAERFFARRLFLRRDLRIRCPRCRGTGRTLHSALCTLQSDTVCDLCHGHRQITFDITF